MPKKPPFKEVAANWAFLISIAIAIILGIVLPNNTVAIGLLVLLGLLVGFVNITAKETLEFLVASIALIVASGSFKLIPVVGELVANILDYIVVFVAPAAGIVSLIAIWRLARTK